MYTEEYKLELVKLVKNVALDEATVIGEDYEEEDAVWAGAGLRISLTTMNLRNTPSAFVTNC